MPPRDRAWRDVEDRQMVQAGRCQDGVYFLRHRDGAVDVVFKGTGVRSRSSPTQLMVFGDDKAHVARVCVAAICKDRDKRAPERAKVEAGEMKPPRAPERYHGAVDRAEGRAIEIGSRYPTLFSVWFQEGERLDVEGFAAAAAIVGGEDVKLMEAVDAIIALGKSDRREIRRRLVGRFDG